MVETYGEPNYSEILKAVKEYKKRTVNEDRSEQNKTK